MPTQNFLDFLDLPASTKIYLVTLTLRYVSGGSVLTEKVYLSNHPFNTTGSESPANTPFLPLLSQVAIPPLRQEISLPFRGTASKLGFGSLVIINTTGRMDSKRPPTRIWEGGEAEVKLTGPRSQLALSDGEVIFKGVMGKPRFSESQIEVEIISRHRELERREMPTTTFTAPNGEVRFAPLAVGICKNIEAPLKDSTSTTNIIYKLAGHELEDVTACYDKGVALAPTTQWTKDLVNGEAALKQAPLGRITWDIKGMKFGSPATFSAKRGDFIKWALENPGGIAAADTDDASFTTFNTDVPGDSGIYITEKVSVLDFCSRLLEPVLGFLIEDRTGIFSVGMLKLPTGTPNLTLTPSKLLFLNNRRDLVEEEPAEPLLHRIVMNYDENGTEMTDGDLGSAADVDPSTQAGRNRREWLKTRWRPTPKELTGATEGRNLYRTAGEVTLDSYFRNKADADTFNTNWTNLFGVHRSFYRCVAKVQPFKTKLHDVVRISNGESITNKDTRSIVYLENYADNRIELVLFA